MSLPLIIFLGLYALVVLVFMVLSAINIYHFFRFGFVTPTVIAIISGYAIIAFIIIGATLAYASTVDWQQAIPILPA